MAMATPPFSSYSGLGLFDGLERDMTMNIDVSTVSTKGVAALLARLDEFKLLDELIRLERVDRLERLDGLGCPAQLL